MVTMVLLKLSGLTTEHHDMRRVTSLGPCNGRRQFEHLQEAALREAIWKLGGSTRRLEAAFGGGRRGLLTFEDFTKGLRAIGLWLEDLQGCGFKDEAAAFRQLDCSGCPT
ncbi:unnamed protein product [Durusdinium trenchii]|uniref:EF-hand domain-containing protein n=1 Tax=Durusdinium trenchii TaxID=1381693 RepID=A0ABP0HCG7_9DINO